MNPRQSALHSITGFALALCITSGAFAVTPQDYAQGRHLRVKDGAALALYTLPLAVLTAVEGELSQVAVFNAAGNVVPHAFRVPEIVQHTQVNHSLPLFPIFEDEARTSGSAANVEVTTQKDGTLTRVYVTNQRAKGDPRTQSVDRYLVDATGVKGSIEALSFVVRPHAAVEADFTWTLHVRAGRSLDNLTQATYTGTLAKLQHQGTSLDVSSIATSGLDAPYLEITWQGDAPGIIERVEATLHAEKVAAPLQSTEVAPSRVVLTDGAKGNSPRATASRFALVYDAQATLPMKSARVLLGEVNTLASVDVFVSSEPPVDIATLGSRVFSGNVYRLSHNGATLESPPVVLNRSGRYVVVMANQTTSEAQLGLHAEQPERWPRLSLSYAPTQALFVASGEGPFTLAYGSYQPSQASSPAGLLAVIVSSSAVQLERDNVTAGDAFGLGSPVAPVEPWPWKRVGLWSVLLLGVGVLVVMTRGLLRRVGA